MKTKLTCFLFILFAFATLQSSAQSKLIHFWDFNTAVVGDSLGNATNPLPASYSTLASSHPKIVYTRPYSLNMYYDSIVDASAAGAFYYDYSSTNYHYFSTSDSANGNNFIKVRNPSAGAYLMFYLPTTGYKNIAFYYALSASSSKAPNSVFSYSTNGGITWNPLTAAMDTFNTGHRMHPDTLQNVDSITIVSGWRPVAINFTSAVNVNNNATFILRITSTGANDTTHSGNIRIDNVAVMGDTDITTGIQETAAGMAGYSVYPNPSQNTVNIISDNYTGNKIITVYNLLGQVISESENPDKQTTLDISSLNAGIYFMEIKEAATGNKYTVKIVKE